MRISARVCGKTHSGALRILCCIDKRTQNVKKNNKTQNCQTRCLLHVLHMRTKRKLLLNENDKCFLSVCLSVCLSLSLCVSAYGIT